MMSTINIHNYNTRVKDTSRTKHEFVITYHRYILPHAINGSFDIIKQNIHSRGVTCYIKTCLQNNCCDICI